MNLIVYIAKISCLNQSLKEKVKFNLKFGELR